MQTRASHAKTKIYRRDANKPQKCLGAVLIEAVAHSARFPHPLRGYGAPMFSVG